MGTQAAELSQPVLVEDIIQAPEFEVDESLRRTVVIKNMANLKLSAKILSRPVASIVWKKDQPETEDLSERAYIENIEDEKSVSTSLLIEKANRYDAGKYHIIADNIAGEKTFTVSVKVLDSPSAPTNLKLKDITKQSVFLPWEAPELDGGSAV